jgi:hypothetical protein
MDRRGSEDAKAGCGAVGFLVVGTAMLTVIRVQNRPVMPDNPAARPSSAMVNEQFPDVPYGFLQIG